MATAAVLQPKAASARRGGVSMAARPLILIVLGLVAAAGLAALYFRLDRGLGVTRLGSVVPWGVWVAFYIYFIGLSAGSFLLSTLIFVFKNKTLEPVGRPDLPRLVVNLSPNGERVMDHLKAEWAGVTFQVVDASPFPRECRSATGCIDQVTR